MAAEGAEGWRLPQRRDEPAPEGADAASSAPPTRAAAGKPMGAVNPRALAALLAAEHGDPFAVLGPHEVAPGLWEVRAFLPEARGAFLEMESESIAMDRRHQAGFFVGRVEGRYRPTYRLRLEIGDRSVIREDPYRFGTCLNDQDVAATREVGGDGVYRKLGAQPTTLEGVAGFNFAVWAPNAHRVSVVGDFNDWDGRRHPMRLRHSGGIWELFVPGVEAGLRYKYEIKGADGGLHLKADPVAFAAEHPPATASVLHAAPEFRWRNDEWLETRAAKDPRHA
ncbi:MAG TPA: 1,4-alpha-glucan branching enzyme, partial [Beijerinckiaceae bacterium]|nr:1,4-alpha-glucan branching enzyme [Beijerinckiaceae bacterium]